MAMRLSKTHLMQAAQRAEGLRNRLANMRKRTEKVMERAVHSTEIAAASFAMGVIQGKTDGIEIMSVPLELGLGVGLNLAGYMGLGGRLSEHLHGFGDGCLAAYLTTLGRGVGIKMKSAGGGTGKLENPNITRQVSRGSDSFSDSELAGAVIDAVSSEVPA